MYVFGLEIFRHIQFINVRIWKYLVMSDRSTLYIQIQIMGLEYLCCFHHIKLIMHVVHELETGVSIFIEVVIHGVDL